MLPNVADGSKAPFSQAGWRLPVFPYEQTSSALVGMSQKCQQRKSQFLFNRVAETCQHSAASVGPEAIIELSYTLALSRWAAMGKAVSSLLVNFPKAFLTSVIRAARAASSACDNGPANGEPAT